MLHSIQQRFGEKLRASDGEIGHVRDFYFDDKNWTVRYLVADTGRWLTGRLVLISPHALGHLYPKGKVLLVNLSRQQIEDSPSIDEHKPVSRQHEENHRHYGYPYYAGSFSGSGSRIRENANKPGAHLRCHSPARQTPAVCAASRGGVRLNPWRSLPSAWTPASGLERIVRGRPRRGRNSP